MERRSVSPCQIASLLNDKCQPIALLNHGSPLGSREALPSLSLRRWSIHLSKASSSSNNKNKDKTRDLDGQNKTSMPIAFDTTIAFDAASSLLLSTNHHQEHT